MQATTRNATNRDCTRTSASPSASGPRDMRKAMSTVRVFSNPTTFSLANRHILRGLGDREVIQSASRCSDTTTAMRANRIYIFENGCKKPFVIRNMLSRFTPRSHAVHANVGELPAHPRHAQTSVYRSTNHLHQGLRAHELYATTTYNIYAHLTPSRHAVHLPSRHVGVERVDDRRHVLVARGRRDNDDRCV